LPSNNWRNLRSWTHREAFPKGGHHVSSYEG
jgi:hypothetical protein